MFDVAKGLLDLARAGFDLVSGARALRQADRDRASDYFAVVGATLAEIAAEIGAGHTPHGKCSELVMHAAHLVACTENVIDTAEAERLAALLDASHDVERMAMTLAAPEQRASQIAALAEAAGRFAAMAHIVRASN
jgi:hypothetical protein